MTDKISFSKYLKDTRKDKKMTLKELASKADTSDSYLSQLENNRRNPPKPKLLKAIANALSDEDKKEATFIYGKLSILAGYNLENDGSEEYFIELAEDLYNDEVLVSVTSIMKEDTKAIAYVKLFTDFYIRNNTQDRSKNISLLISVLSYLDQINNSTDEREIDLLKDSALDHLNILIESLK